MNASEVAPIGVVLFGHGARNPLWAKPMEQIAQKMRADSGLCVSLAFLEFLQPGLQQACQELARDFAIKKILVIPVFLAGAGHLINDLPDLLQSVRLSLPDLIIEQKPPLGDRQEVIDALVLSFLQDAASARLS